MFKKVSYLVLALALFVGALGFVGCDASGGEEITYVEIPVPEILKGKWVSAYGEEYTISGTTFASNIVGYGGYGGDIVRVRGKNGNAADAYITIKYTHNDNDPSAKDKYYVIHYGSITSKNMEISGAASLNDPDFAWPKGGGKATAAEAEALYTLENGYFDLHSFTSKIGGGPGPQPPVPDNLKNTWHGENDGLGYYSLIIDSDSVGCTYTMPEYELTTPYFTAEIVKVRELSATSGYITLLYTVNQTTPNQGKYGVLYYQNLTGSSAKMVVAADNAAGWGGISKATAAEAESTYVYKSAEGYLANDDPDNEEAVLVDFTLTAP